MSPQGSVVVLVPEAGAEMTTPAIDATKDSVCQRILKNHSMGINECEDGENRGRSNHLIMNTCNSDDIAKSQLISLFT